MSVPSNVTCNTHFFGFFSKRLFLIPSHHIVLVVKHSMNILSYLNRFRFACFIITGCSTPLGMESGEIKDSQITASHWLYKSAHYQAKNARLNSDSPGGAWCSEGIHEESDQYIEIDLLKNTKVTGIATQGRKMLTEYVESFQILYRRDGDEEQYKQYNVSGSWKVSQQYFHSIL